VVSLKSASVSQQPNNETPTTPRNRQAPSNNVWPTGKPVNASVLPTNHCWGSNCVSSVIRWGPHVDIDRRALAEKSRCDKGPRTMSERNIHPNFAEPPGAVTAGALRMGRRIVAGSGVTLCLRAGGKSGPPRASPLLCDCPNSGPTSRHASTCTAR